MIWDEHRRMAGFRTEGGETRFERDPAGRLRAAVDPTGVTTQFDWDERGLLRSATDAAGAVSNYRYDERGRLVSQTMPGDRTTTWSYDLGGRVGSTTDPMGVTTQVLRNGSGAITGIRRADEGWTAPWTRSAANSNGPARRHRARRVSLRRRRPDDDGGGPRHGAVHRVPLGRGRPPHPGHRRQRHEHDRTRRRRLDGRVHEPDRDPHGRRTGRARPGGRCARRPGRRLPAPRLGGRPRPRRPPAHRTRWHGLPLRRRRPAGRDGTGRSGADDLRVRRRRAHRAGRSARPSRARSTTTPPAGCGRSPSTGPALSGTARSRSSTTRPAVDRSRSNPTARSPSTSGTPSTSWSRSCPHEPRPARPRACASTSTPSADRNGSTTSSSVRPLSGQPNLVGGVRIVDAGAISWRSDDATWGRDPPRPARRTARPRDDACSAPGCTTRAPGSSSRPTR